jgi:hypothetical protein
LLGSSHNGSSDTFTTSFRQREDGIYVPTHRPRGCLLLALESEKCEG